MSSRSISYEPHPSPEARHGDEASDFRFELDEPHSHDSEASQNPFESGDISDEKAACDLSSPGTYVIDPARDHVDSNVPSSFLDFNQRPGSARSSFYSIGNNQLDSHRASRRSYMEEYSEFHTAMEDEPEGPVDYDDDGDDWGDSSPKKRLGSSFCNSISIRGLLNMGAVTLLAMGLVIIFGVLPITTYKGSHRQAQQLAESGGSLGSGNNTTDTQNIMMRRRFDDSDLNIMISDKLTADGSLRTSVYSASNVAHQWSKWEIPVTKNWEHQHLSDVKPEKATSTNKKRSSRKIIDVEL